MPSTILLYFLGVFGHLCTKRAAARRFARGTYLILVIFCVNSSVSNTRLDPFSQHHGSSLLKFTDCVRNPAHHPWKWLRRCHVLLWFCAEPSKKHQKVQIYHRGGCRIPPSPSRFTFYGLMDIFQSPSRPFQKYFVTLARIPYTKETEVLAPVSFYLEDFVSAQLIRRFRF